MNEPLSFPLIDELDPEILMARDAHFGGSFSVMYDYYAKEGKGVRSEFDLGRIEQLQHLETGLGINLADEILFDPQKEAIAEAKQKYSALRDCYSEKQSLSRLIADLIFSEDDDPAQEIAAIVAFGNEAVPALIELISSEDYFNPLFPGYGEAPALAARCLGLIGDERGIRPLFEALGHGDFFMEEAILDALILLGDKAKAFLLDVLKKMPITKENEQAAIALIGFKDDSEIAKVCLQVLSQGKNAEKPTFAAYLVMGCHGLNDPKDREEFIQISQRRNLPIDVRQEMEVIIQKWKQTTFSIKRSK